MASPAPAKLNVPPAVRRYMQELELILKQMRGISPEEALADAREFLLADYEALSRSQEPPDPDQHYEWIVNHFGAPSKVAQQYALESDPPPSPPRAGYAPGWRICCKNCGRSAPYASTGAVRIGGYSRHKYILGYCKHCARLRWCRVTHDLDQTNLTDMLCLNQTPEELRQKIHMSVFKLVGLILLLVLAINLLVWAVILAVNPWKAIERLPATPAIATLSPADTFGMLPVVYQTTDGQEVYKQATRRLKDAVTKQYSYRDLKGIQWEQVIDQAAPQLSASRSKAEFAKSVAGVMARAQDLHIWLDVDKTIVPTYQSRAALNFNPRMLPRILKSFKQHGTTVITGRATDEIDYVLIATWDNSQPDSMAAAVQAVERACQSKRSLIIDIRPNSGGDENNAKRVAANFIQQPTHYATARVWSNGVAAEPFKKILSPSEIGRQRRQSENAKCLVLMGPTNMSSAELFLRMMRAAGVKLMGEPSRGTSGNPQPHELCEGVQLYLPSWQIVDDQGQVLEGQGIQPDVELKTKRQDYQTGDPVLKEAIARLSSVEK